MADGDQTPTVNQEGPGGRPVGWYGVIPGAILLVALSVLCLYTLVALWPHPTPSGALPNTDTTGTQSNATTDPKVAREDCKPPNDPKECDCLARVLYKRKLHDQEKSPDSPRLKDDPTCVYMFGKWLLIWNETRLILIVILSGFLGALVYSLRSFFWYAGNRELKWSWLLMYLLVPIVGAMLAMIFYLLLRGGLFSPTTTVADTSPFGFAAIAALVGMFTNQASEKLRTVFETLMTKPATGRDASTVAPPTITSVAPPTVNAGVDTLLTVKGTGFTQTSVVIASATELKPTTGSISANQLTVTIPAAISAKNASFKIAVSTPGAGKSNEVEVPVSPSGG